MLRVIHGGKGKAADGKSRWQNRLRDLTRIEVTLSRMERSNIGPRSSQAMSAAMAAAAAVAILELGLQGQGWSMGTLPLHLGQLVVLAPLATGLAVFALVLAYSSRAKTWPDQLDSLLSRYDPQDKEAYRQLQEEIRSLGYFDQDEVFKWILCEKHAVKISAGWRTPEQETFVNRKI